MAELKLFKINGTVEELKSKSVTIEKELQRIIEKNMQDFRLFLNTNDLQARMLSIKGYSILIGYWSIRQILSCWF